MLVRAFESDTSKRKREHITPFSSIIRIRIGEFYGVDEKLDRAFWAMRLGLGATAFLAGADKFTNLLTRWEKYLAPQAKKNIPVSKSSFMRAAGIVEMLVGIGILSPRAKVASYAASVWLLSIALNLVLNQDYDIAVRDINMAIGAFALAEMSDAHARNIKNRDLIEHRLNAA